MSAPLAHPISGQAVEIDTRTPTEKFQHHCEVRSRYVVDNTLPLWLAVDEMQAYAQLSGLIDHIGQDAVQDIMSGAFVFAEIAPDELSEACEQEIMLRTADLVRRWEAEAPLPPPKPAPTRQRCEPPQSTIDAFWYVVSLGKPQYLRTWLHDRPRDKAYLLKILESKRCCKFQPKR
jgi:hypothetical protein